VKTINQSIHEPTTQSLYPAEVQGGTRGHGSTHGAEFGPGHQEPVAEGRGPAEAVLQLGGQGGQGLVTVLPTPPGVTPGGGSRWWR